MDGFKQVGFLVVAIGLMVSGGCVAQQADVARVKHEFDEKISRLGLSRAELESAMAEAHLSLEQARSVIARQQDDIRHLSQAGRILHDQIGSLRDEEVAPLRGEVEQVVHATSTLRSDLEEIQAVTHLLQDHSKVQHQEWRTAMAEVTEMLHQKQVEQERAIQSERVLRSTLTEFKEVLDSLNQKMVQQASQFQELEIRVQQTAQSVTSNASQTSAYLSDVQVSVASLAGSLKETYQILSTRLDQQEQRLSHVAKAGIGVPVKNEEGAASSDDFQGVLETVTRLQKTIELVAQQLGDRVDAHEEKLANLGRGHVMPSSRVTVPSLPVRVDSQPNGGHQQISLPVAKSKQQVSSMEQEFYQSAFHLLQNQQIDPAIFKFDEFLRQFPSSPLAPNAQYWKGECYYSSQQYESAIREFELVLKHYPTDEKAPAALLKIGYGYLGMNNPLLARNAFRELVRLFPNSSESTKAYTKLTQVNLPSKPSS